MAVLAHDLDREAHGRIGLEIVRCAVAVGGDLGVVEFGQVLAEISVGRQAVVATVNLGDSERNALARRRWQGSLAQGTVEAEVALEGGRTVGDETEHVRHDAELLLDTLEQELRGSWSISNRSGVGRRDMAVSFRLLASMTPRNYDLPQMMSIH
jgi:hypothetical protein